MGRLREGLEAGVSALEWIDSPMWRAVVLENVAEIEFEMCDPIASTHFEESMTICGEEGEYATGVVARLGLARIAYEQGSRTEAILDAQSIERSTAVGGVKVKVLTTLAEFLLRCDGVPDALLYLERAREMAAFDETEAPKLLRLNGLALVLQGNSTAGLSMLDEAVDRARSMAMELETGRSLVARGVAGTDTWRSFHRARQIFAACGSERGLAEVRRAVAGSYV
jgi:hypothetical protein